MLVTLFTMPLLRRNRKSTFLLPVELITQIFSYLSVPDLRDCTFVCRQWWHAANIPSLWRGVCVQLNINSTSHPLSSEVLSVLQLRRISRIAITVASDAERQCVESVGKMVLDTLEVLFDCLVELHLNVGRLVSCLSWLENLGNLLHNSFVETVWFDSACVDMTSFAKFGKFERLKEIAIPIQTASSLKTLCLCMNQLETLGVTDLRLSSGELSEAMSLGNNITYLSLGNCHLTDDDIFIINDYMENQLLYLTLEHNDIGDAALNDISSRQNRLVLLNVNSTYITVSGLNDALEIATLTTLSVSHCHEMADESSTINFERLQHLSCLDLSGCHGIRSVVMSSESRLSHVNLSCCVAIQEWTFTSMCSSLECLDIGNCTGLSQNKLAVMIQSLPCCCPQLSMLKVDWLLSINDDALLGLENRPECTATSSSGSLFGKEAKKKSSIPCMSSDFMRERAFSVKYKNAIAHKLGIMGLAQLTELCLTGCSRISSEAMSLVLKFPRLTSLDISEVFQVTDWCLVDIMRGCPILERLFVSSCYNISDFAAMMMAKRLKRLTHLGVAYAAISDTGIDALSKGLRRLVWIDISYCTDVTAKSLVVLRERLPCLLELHARHLPVVANH